MPNPTPTVAEAITAIEMGPDEENLCRLCEQEMKLLNSEDEPTALCHDCAQKICEMLPTAHAATGEAEALKCPNCGCSRHVDPLPGTRGRRCVRCCGVIEELQAQVRELREVLERMVYVGEIDMKKTTVWKDAKSLLESISPQVQPPEGE